MADKWQRRAITWLLLPGLAGVALYVGTEGDIKLGLGFAVATILIDVALLMAHEDWQRHRQEKPNGD